MANQQTSKKSQSFSTGFTLSPIAACVRIAMLGGIGMYPLTATHAAGNLPVPSPVWASMGNATASITGNHMRIDQHTDRAILNWQSFNIGQDHSVHFQQPGANSIALNRIFQNDPSRILGTLTANGQVYLVNSNGFVFGKNSKVDVRGLVASTLSITDDVFDQGITKVFANNGTAAFNGNGDFYLKNEDGSFRLDEDGNKIKIAINIDEGAQIKSTEGQNILIIAPTITNEGNIEADDRQVVLAAATDRVYLQEAGNEGLLVEVQTGGEINNLGSIASKRGTISLVGFAVNQKGKVSASTSMNINGKIRLIAREGATTFQTPDGYAMQASRTTRATDSGDNLGKSATVSLGENSQTEILPELDTGLTAIDEQAQPLSQIDIMAHKVHFQSGSQVNLPGGKINVVATQNPSNPLQASANRNDSRILIDSGAKIDVSGVKSTVKPMESNVVAVELRLNQLSDAPLQRNGVLFGETIFVDIRAGTPLANIQPAIDAIERPLGERLAKGGEINLSSEGDTLVKDNAILDFSGGAVKFLDGYIRTSKLISNGRVFDISEAHPSLRYDGIYGKVVKNHKKWGVEQAWITEGPFALARKEAGYTDGHDAGSLTIASPNVILEGQLNGTTVSGRLQRTLAERPKGGTLTIDMRSASEVDQAVVFANVLTSSTVNVDLNQPFPSSNDSRFTPLVLRTQSLSQSGIMDLSVLAHGTVTVSDGSRLKLADGAQLNLQGGAITIGGEIKGAGAQVNLATDLNARTQGRLSGAITLGSNAKIDLQGGWVNDLTTPFDLLDNNKITLDGGSFIARANGDIDILKGSRIDVGGGAWLQTSGNIQDGKAGGIHLHAEAETTGSNITLDGTLSAYAIRQGGTLELEANAIAILRRREEELEGLRPLQLEADFFAKGGFSDYILTANINGLVVDEGVKIKLQQTNRLLNGDAINRSSSNNIAGISRLGKLPAIDRLPSNLTLQSVHSINPNPNSHLIVNNNTEITADALSNVSLVSDSSLFFDGSIKANGGNVALSIIPPQGLPTLDPLYQPRQGLWLGDNARIDVSGIAMTLTDEFGLKTGMVHNGGNVNLTAARGYVATSSGSQIDASGTEALLNRPRLLPGAENITFSTEKVGSHGGTITISSVEAIFIEGGMLAKGGKAPGTSGGTLTVRLDDTLREIPVEEGVIPNFPIKPSILNFSQTKNEFFDASFSQYGDALPTGLQRQGFIAAQQVSDSGFANLNVQADGEIRFQGDIHLDLQHAVNFDSPKLAWQRLSESDTGRVVFNAAHAALGSSRTRRATGNPTGGDGQLQVNADLIELFGGVFTAGFKQVDLNADSDIRLRGIRTLFTQRDYLGEFSTYSALNLKADQVYPTTLSEYRLTVKGDPNGSIAFSSGDQSRPILSAYAKLTVTAPNIQHDGAIKVPFGELTFDASQTIHFGANSLSSVSAEDQIIPFGVTEAGLEWLYPIDNQNLIVQTPTKKITVNADRIQHDEGAVIDISGGGDLLAYEFIPGIGGSVDVLATGNSFAILPNHSGYAPFDPLEFPGSGLSIGDSIYLGEGSGLKAGYYTLLPARYALLPGSYLITPQQGSDNMAQGSRSVNLDGASVVAGFRAISGTGIKEQTWSGFAVEPGEIALTRSQLDLSTANQFFVEQAQRKESPIPRLPEDAGSLLFNAKSQLELPSVLANANNGGLAGLVDVIADNIAVVNDRTGAEGRVELSVSDLDTFTVGSLFLGGIRTIDNETGAINLDVKSKTVEIAEGTRLEGSEIIMGATDRIELQAGAQIVATGGKDSSAPGQVLTTRGDGALLRVSGDAQAQIVRTDTQGLRGDLVINDNAQTLAANGSILLDSTRNLQMNGMLDAGKSLNIAAEAINIGEVSENLPGLSLDNGQLSQLNVEQLVLTSRSNLNIYGGVYRTDASGLALRNNELELMPIEFNLLTIATKGIAGFDNSGKSAGLSADTVTLINASNSVQTEKGNGTGSLSIAANNLVLAGGDFTLSGFNDINLNLAESLIGSSVNTLNTLADTTITAGFITGTSGSETRIDADTYRLALNHNPADSVDSQPGIAARLNLNAGHVVIDTPLQFNSGIVKANAKTGDIVLKENAAIDVSGTMVRAGLSESAPISAGRIDLTARQNINTEAGSQLLLNAISPQMSAGSLALSATTGLVNLNGTINAKGGHQAEGGSVRLDLGSMGGNPFGLMNQSLVDSGFSRAIDLRLRNGNLVIDEEDSISANDIKLTVDKGALTIAGTLDASGQHGGSIELNAHSRLTLSGSARLHANATEASGDGGKVRLNSTNGGGISIQNGASIDVSANGGREGDVHIRAERLAGQVNVAPIAPGTIIGDSNVVIEAVAQYNLNRLDAAAINSLRNDTALYMNSVSTTAFGPGFELAPGIEVKSEGNLTLAANWDLVDWRYGPEQTPGYLTLRTGGDLLFQNGVSDAFKNGVLQVTPTFSRPVIDMLQPGRSWSYNFVAGADLNSSDTKMVVAADNLNFGDVRLFNDVKIRTGTGAIDFSAGRDIVYGNDKSVVYTAGRPDDEDRFGFPLIRVASNFYVEYPKDGGDIRFSAGRDIRGAVTNQIASDWLLRTGNWSRNETHTGERPTAWGIAIGTRTGSGIAPDYRQNVGALGGGNITITAGGTVSDLSVVIPTTGKQVGQRVDPNDFTNQNYLTNEVEINGGGDLNISAGGDLKGGIYYVDNGTATFNVAGSLNAGSFKTVSITEMNPILALGNAQYHITAGKDIALQAIIDPMILSQPANKRPDLLSIFFRYGENSAVNLTSLTGNISLGNDVSGVVDLMNFQRGALISFDGGARDALSVAPGTLKAYALSNDIIFKNGLIMYPSKVGQFELFAANNIITASNGNAVNVTMSDTNSNLLPTVLNPAANYNDARLRLVLSGITNEPDKIYASIPNHINDPIPALISTDVGDILGKDPFQFIMAKPTQVSAGRDIRNVSLQFQHNIEGAESIVSAGRDFKFDIVRNPATGALVNVVQRMEVSGPGRLTIMAGRHVDLGSSEGITTTGNQVNTALAEDGAAINVVAGLAQTQFAAPDFMKSYLSNGESLYESYELAVADYMRRITGNDDLTVDLARAAFARLPAVERSHFNAPYLADLIETFNGLMKNYGNRFSIAKNSFDSASDTQARFNFKLEMDKAQFELLAAIETLFPGTTVLAGRQDYTIDPANGTVFREGASASSILEDAFSKDRNKTQTGDISMFFSKIHSTDGGDINLLTPNGGINAGLAVNSSGAKDASQLGVVAIKKGAVHSIVRDDFQVNTTRVMTLGGGDILIGSTDGNIDAGRGAKTALAAPAPIIRFDSEGNIIIELPPAVAGSGIRANMAPDGSQGDALLFALQGIIDASEAGVGGKDVTVGATAIVGSDNIDVGGVSVGVPTASTGSLAAGLGNVNNVAASIAQAIDDTSDVAKSAKEQMDKAGAQGIISVDIIGFGDEDV
ncbi:filamentous haemagglutinin family protein [Methylotuvimicrobium sp. KM2]|uniref:filamentous haemagglutinin family protein n=1 Tax=Methylotuvimicrobium sp. KM2 TaxID=3133976 RepID=UPI0031010C63